MLKLIFKVIKASLVCENGRKLIPPSAWWQVHFKNFSLSLMSTLRSFLYLKLWMIRLVVFWAGGWGIERNNFHTPRAYCDGSGLNTSETSKDSTSNFTQGVGCRLSLSSPFNRLFPIYRHSWDWPLVSLHSPSPCLAPTTSTLWRYRYIQIAAW